MILEFRESFILANICFFEIQIGRLAFNIIDFERNYSQSNSYFYKVIYAALS